MSKKRTMKANTAHLLAKRGNKQKNRATAEMEQERTAAELGLKTSELRVLTAPDVEIRALAARVTSTGPHPTWRSDRHHRDL